MFFVCLHVLTEFHLAMSVKVQFAIEYDFRWALRLGNATLQGEHVAPEHGYVYHFYYYDRRQVIKRDYVVITANPLWDVLVSRCGMKLGM